MSIVEQIHPQSRSRFYHDESLRWSTGARYWESASTPPPPSNASCSSTSIPSYGPGLNKLPNKSVIKFPWGLGILISNQTSPIFTRAYNQTDPSRDAVHHSKELLPRTQHTASSTYGRTQQHPVDMQQSKAKESWHAAKPGKLKLLQSSYEQERFPRQEVSKGRHWDQCLHLVNSANTNRGEWHGPSRVLQCGASLLWSNRRGGLRGQWGRPSCRGGDGVLRRWRRLLRQAEHL